MVDHAGSGPPSSHRRPGLTLQLPRSDVFKDHDTVVNWNPSLNPPGPPTPTEGNPSTTAHQASSLEAAEPSFLSPELQGTAASQQPHASTMRMSVNNCHMLQFRLSKAHPDLSPPPKADVELVSIPTVSTPSVPMAQPAGSKQKAGLLKKQLTYLSVKLPYVNKMKPALVTVTPGKHTPAVVGCICQKHAVVSLVHTIAGSAVHAAEPMKFTICLHHRLQNSLPPLPLYYACLGIAGMTTPTKLHLWYVSLS